MHKKLSKKEVEEILREAYEHNYFKDSYNLYKLRYPKFWKQLITFDENYMKTLNKLIYDFNDEQFTNYIKKRNDFIKFLTEQFYGKKI